MKDKIDRVKMELAKVQVERETIQETIEKLSPELIRLTHQVDCLRTRRQKLLSKEKRLSTSLKDLNSGIQTKRWYFFTYHNILQHSPMVYIVSMRRPKKYRYVTLYYVQPYRQRCPPDRFLCSFVEVSYPQLVGYLKEGDEQNKLGVLMRWGIPETRLLDSIRHYWEKYFSGEVFRLKCNSNGSTAYYLFNTNLKRVNRILLQLSDSSEPRLSEVIHARQGV